MVGTIATALATILGAATVSAADVGKLVQISRGDPFAGCKADNVKGQEKGGSFVWPATEVEPFIAADPANPDNLLAGFQQDRWTDGGSRGLVAGVSKDGGGTWKEAIPPGVSLCTGGPYQRASDPWVSFAPDGTAYFMSLVINGTVNSKGSGGMVVSRSTDGGLTWGKPTTLITDPNAQLFSDKNAITADPTDSRFAYATWDRLQGLLAEEEREEEGDGGKVPETASTPEGRRHDSVFLARQALRDAVAAAAPSTSTAPKKLPPKGPTYFSRTTDGGKTWEKARIIYDPGLYAQTLGNQIVVQPNGTVIDFFSNLVFAQQAPRIGLVRSHDKGGSFEKAPNFIASVNITVAGTVTPDEPFYFVRTAAALFDVAVDPKNGNLYVVWQDARFAGVEAIAFSMSTDGGDTWSTPVQINQTPPLTVKTRRQAFIPSVEVGPGGVVVVTYYDFRNDNASGELTDYWAVLCDPGKADCRKGAGWGGELRLTPKSFDILNAPVTTRALFLGDYMGLTRAGDAVVPAFGIADGRQRSSIYTRKITFGGKAAVVSLGQ